MSTSDHVLRLHQYLSAMGSKEGQKPYFSLDRWGDYILFGGKRTDGERFMVNERYTGRFAEALSNLVLAPETYAHFLDASLPYDDNLGSEDNGYVEDFFVHQVSLYTDGMKEGVKPSYDIHQVNGLWRLVSGFINENHDREVIGEVNGDGVYAISTLIPDSRDFAHNNDPAHYSFCSHPGNIQNGYVEFVAS